MTETPTTAPIKQAFILGAGLGSRMRPLTDTTPKPLIRLGGRPLLDHVLDRLKAVGVERVIVNVHYLADQMITHLETRNDLEIIISDERHELLDTGGGLIKASKHLNDDPFFIHNSDSVWLEDSTAAHSNLARMVAAWQPEKMQSLMLLANRHDALGYSGKGDFHIMADGILKRRGAAEATDFVFAGVSIAHPSLLENAPAGAFSLNLLWNNGLARGSIYGIRHRGRWMHVGTSEALSEAEHCLTAKNI